MLVEWVLVELQVQMLTPACKQISAGHKQDRPRCQGGPQTSCPRHQQKHCKRVHKRCIAMFRLQEHVQVLVKWVLVELQVQVLVEWVWCQENPEENLLQLLVQMLAPSSSPRRIRGRDLVASAVGARGEGARGEGMWPRAEGGPSRSI